jgi:microcystin-dependent protein
MAWLTGDQPVEGEFWCRLTRVPGSLGFLQAVGGALGELTNPRNWEKFGTMTPEESAEMATELFYEWTRSDACMIGAVMAYVTTTPPPSCLPCNGSVYQRVDYPRLYEKLAAAYIIDGDTFRTPDLRDKFVFGASVDHPLASVGGAAEHTMTIDELVPHDHSTIPHSHTEIGAVDTLVNGGVEAPAASATAFPTTTGLADVTINPTGGGAPFSILPPYEAMSYCIVAK